MHKHSLISDKEASFNLACKLSLFWNYWKRLKKYLIVSFIDRRHQTFLRFFSKKVWNLNLGNGNLGVTNIIDGVQFTTLNFSIKYITKIKYVFEHFGRWRWALIQCKNLARNHIQLQLQRNCKLIKYLTSYTEVLTAMWKNV